MKDSLQIAAVQFQNRAWGSDFISEIVEQILFYVDQVPPADVIVFPELFCDVEEIFDRINKNNWRTLVKKIKQISTDSGKAILAGSFARITPAGTYNTAIFAMPDKRVVFQDKLFLTPNELAAQWSRGNILQIFDLFGYRACVLICHDCEIPVISNRLALQSPEIILVPSLTSELGFRRVAAVAQARAVEHHAYVVVTGVVSQNHTGAVGQAQLFTPCEAGFPSDTVTGRRNVAEVVTFSLDMKLLRLSRDRDIVFPARAQRSLHFDILFS